MRRRIRLATVGAMLLVGGSLLGSAVPAAAGTCPENFSEWPANGAPEDRNGDGIVCRRLAGPPGCKCPHGAVVVDNNRP